MDEPLSNLDAKLRNQMRAEIILLRKKIDTTFVYVTHDQTEAMTLGDRIVIMKDGFIQQVGTPQEMFDHPINLFVAGFIGTPQMNFFEARLTKENGRYFVCVGTMKVELSDEKQQRLSERGVCEQDITLGVRPNHITLSDDDQNVVEATVDVQEMMGSEIHLHLTVNNKDVIAIVPAVDFAGERRAAFKNGMKVALSIRGGVCHVFDANGQNLEWC